MVRFTPRQAQVVELVAKGLPDKRIAAKMGISIKTVHRHMEDAAAQIPGDGSRRYRLLLYFYATRGNREALQIIARRGDAWLNAD